MANQPQKYRVPRIQTPWEPVAPRNEEILLQRLNDVLRNLEEVKLEAADFNLTGLEAGDILVATSGLVLEPTKTLTHSYTVNQNLTIVSGLAVGANALITGAVTITGTASILSSGSVSGNWRVSGDVLIPNNPTASSATAALLLGSSSFTGDADGNGIVAAFSSAYTGEYLRFEKGGSPLLFVADSGHTTHVRRNTDPNSVAESMVLLGSLETGTVTNGFGRGFCFQLQTNGAAQRDAASIDVSWANATDATRRSLMAFSCQDGATKLPFLRGSASGGVAMVGFLGATAIVRPSATTDLKDAFVNLGLYTDGGATPLNLDSGTLTAANVVINGVSGRELDILGSSTQTQDFVRIRENGTTELFIIEASGATTHTRLDSGTNDQQPVLTLNRRTTGTPAAGFGGRMNLGALTTSQVRDAARIRWEWVNPTDATRTGRLSFEAVDTALRECLRIETNGSAAMIGFLGTTAKVRPSAYTQTYSTADRTHAARTAAALTDNVAGTSGTTIAAIPDPADAPASADALRDDLVTNTLPAIRNALTSLIVQANRGRDDALDTSQLVNSILDDLGDAAGFGLLND